MRMSFRAVATVVAMAVFSVAPAAGQNMDSYRLSNNLGTLLAAEEACELSYDQSAIAAFIENEVAADDMDFPDLLDTSTYSAKLDIEEMSASSLTAHCTQIRRIAKSFNFID